MDRKVYEFISDKSGDPIIERRKCKVSGQNFPIYQSDIDFQKKISPTFDNNSFEVPLPTLCPEERKRRRLSWRNEKSLYKRKCDLTGKSIISNISPDKPYKVYAQDIWWSDKWDAMDYGRDFDFSRLFFDQFNELMKEVPFGTFVVDCENSEYTNYSTNDKNCYLSYCISYCEDCLYSKFIQKSKNCIDCLYTVDCEYCYQCTDVNNCYNLQYAFKCESCSNSNLLIDCEGCSDCYGCINLTNKQYYIFNKQHTKEEYKKFVSKIDNKNLESDRSKFREKSQKEIVKTLNLVGCDNCYGDYLTNSQNCKNCLDGFDAQDCKDCDNFGYAQDLYNCSFVGYETKLGYEVLAAEQMYNCIVSSGVDIKNVYYSFLSMHSSDCFGCVGVRNKQYCIFNKQYTKQEYEKTVSKIIKHMQSTGERGEFFPIDISPFGYNETIAQEVLPIDIQEANDRGYKRQEKEYPINIPEGIAMINTNDLPDILDVEDDILNKAIICSVSNKPYRIVKAELEFYRKHNLPLPHKHPDIRHWERLNKRPARTLGIRNCDKCGIEMLSAYPSDSPHKVYCQSCYDKEVY